MWASNSNGWKRRIGARAPVGDVQRKDARHHGGEVTKNERNSRAG